MYLLLEDTAIFYLSVVKYCFTFQHLVVIVKYESDETNILHKKEKYKRMISFFGKNPFIGNAVFFNQPDCEWQFRAYERSKTEKLI